MQTRYFKVQTKNKPIEDGGRPVTFVAHAMTGGLIDFSMDSYNGFAYSALSVKEAKQLISVLQDVISEVMKV